MRGQIYAYAASSSDFVAASSITRFLTLNIIEPVVSDMGH